MRKIQRSPWVSSCKRPPMQRVFPRYDVLMCCVVTVYSILLQCALSRAFTSKLELIVYRQAMKTAPLQGTSHSALATINLHWGITWPIFCRWLFECICLYDDCCILIQISLKFIPDFQINEKSALDGIMDWRWTGGKSIHEPMMTKSYAVTWRH